MDRGGKKMSGEGRSGGRDGRAPRRGGKKLALKKGAALTLGREGGMVRT